MGARDLDEIGSGSRAVQLLDRGVEVLPEVLRPAPARAGAQLVGLLHGRGVRRPGVAGGCGLATYLGLAPCDRREVGEAMAESSIWWCHAVRLDCAPPVLLNGREHLLDGIQLRAQGREG